MRINHWVLAAGLLTSACGGTHQPPPQEDSPMSTESQIHGTWVYAPDPAGELSSEAVYEGSVLHFGPDGSYSFTMGQIVLSGTYDVVQADDAVNVAITLDSGDEMQAQLKPRDGGLVILEGDGTLPGRFYAPKAD